MSKIKQQQFYHWKSIVPQLKKNVDQCIRTLRLKTITAWQPQNFEEKKSYVKEMIEKQQNIDLEQYLQVFGYMIEQRIDISLLNLANEFAETFGYDSNYWTIKITSWAIPINYTNALTIWNVTAFVRNFINYKKSPIERDKIYQWRPKSQGYLQSLSFLLRRIEKLKKTDTSYSLDESYLKYHKEKILYMTYISTVGLEQSQEKCQYEQVTITFANKSKAQKKLFNFPQSSKSSSLMDFQFNKNSRLAYPRKSVNTLEKYNFFQSKSSVIQEIDASADEQEKKMQRQRFLNILQNIGKQTVCQIDQLRRQLKQSKEKQQQETQRRKFHSNQIQQSQQHFKQIQIQQHQSMMMNSTKKSHHMHSKEEPILQILQIESLETYQNKKYPLNHYTHLSNPRDYFEFQAYPIAYRKQMHVNNPFKMYPWVNYWINDRQEYEQLRAICLDEESNGEEDDQDDQVGQSTDEGQNSIDNFIDTRVIVTYQENEDYYKLTPQDRMEFMTAMMQNRVRWVAQGKSSQGEDILSNFPIVPRYQEQIPYTMEGTDDVKKNKSKRSNLSDSSQSQYQTLTDINTINQMHQIQQYPEQEDRQTTNQKYTNQSLLSVTNTNYRVSANNVNNNNKHNKKQQQMQQTEYQYQYEQNETNVKDDYQDDQRSQQSEERNERSLEQNQMMRKRKERSGLRRQSRQSRQGKQGKQGKQAKQAKQVKQKQKSKPKQQNQNKDKDKDKDKEQNNKERNRNSQQHPKSNTANSKSTQQQKHSTHSQQQQSTSSQRMTTRSRSRDSQYQYSFYTLDQGSNVVVAGGQKQKGRNSCRGFDNDNNGRNSNRIYVPTKNSQTNIIVKSLNDEEQQQQTACLQMEGKKYQQQKQKQKQKQAYPGQQPHIRFIIPPKMKIQTQFSQQSLQKASSMQQSITVSSNHEFNQTQFTVTNHRQKQGQIQIVNIGQQNRKKRVYKKHPKSQSQSLSNSQSLIAVRRSNRLQQLQNERRRREMEIEQEQKEGKRLSDNNNKTMSNNNNNNTHNANINNSSSLANNINIKMELQQIDDNYHVIDVDKLEIQEDNHQYNVNNYNNNHNNNNNNYETTMELMFEQSHRVQQVQKLEIQIDNNNNNDNANTRMQISDSKSRRNSRMSIQGQSKSKQKSRRKYNSNNQIQI